MEKCRTVATTANTCYGCGVCKPFCPVNAIQFHIVDNDFQYAYIESDKCIDCNLCQRICPSKGWKDVYTLQDSNDSEIYKGLSPFENFYFCHSVDTNIRRNGASGGTVTAIVKYLLENNYIDGALLVDYDEKLNAKFRVFTNIDEIMKSQKSVYLCIQFDVLPKELKKYKKLAIVGLPCHLEAINNVCLIFPEIANLIRYKIGLFCAHVQSKIFYKHLLEQKQINIYNLSRLTFRPGDWWKYDYFQVSTKNKVYTWPFRESKYVTALIISRIFSREACLYCPDFMASNADMAFGDGWHKKMKGDKEGFNYAIIRSEKGAEIFKNASDENIINTIESNIDEFKDSHLFNTFLYKHYGVRERISYLKTYDNNALSNITAAGSPFTRFKIFFYFNIKKAAVKLEEMRVLHKLPRFTYFIALLEIYLLRNVSLSSYIKLKFISKLFYR